MEDDKIVAEWMGGKMIVENHHGINLIKFPDGKVHDLAGLKYHTSWDWLMVVVKKIESENEMIASYILSTDIDATYAGVLKYINWYNKNKEK
jgi:hypothetical protein